MSETRLNELVALIQYHDKKFWEDNDPQISDSEYDLLREELKTLDPDNPVINKVHNVLPASTKREKIKHRIAMLSLDKVYSIADLLKWCTSVARTSNEQFRIEPKLDGCSACVDNNIIATRGDDGVTGENITNKNVIMTYEGKDVICNMEELDCRRDLGEILVKKSMLTNNEKLLRRNGKKYKHTRSAAVGLLALDEPNTSVGRALTFVSFNRYSWLLTLDKMKSINWDDWIKDIKSWDYPTDGLVIKLNDEEYSHSLGYTSHHPKGQIALKFGNPTGNTILTNVIWHLGKGKITPVGHIKPVVIDGFEINKISLHNMAYIKDNDIAIGDEITIERCGEIIPQYKCHISRPINRVELSINICPICGSNTVYDNPDIRCTNEYCPGYLLKQLTDSVIRLGIDNIGPGTIDKLIDIHKIEDIADIFDLTIDDFLELDGFAETSATNAYNEIHNICNQACIEDWRVLSCLNIPTIGTRMAKKILKDYTFEQILTLEEKDLVDIDGIGPERAKYIYEWFIDTDKIAIIKRLLEHLPEIDNTKDHLIKGSICFTGKDPKGLGRTHYQKLAESDGFEFSKSVSKDLTYLVTNDPNSTSTKMQKAIKNGTTILSYEQFEEMLS